MRSKTGITIAYCSALVVALCTGQVVLAQAAPTTSPSTGSHFEDSTNELNVEVGKAVLVDCAQPIERVAMGAEEVAEAEAVSPTEIMIRGKGPGETSLIIWDIHGGRQFFNVTVRPNAGLSGDNLDAVRRELRSELPGQTIKVTYTNNSVFLRGTVKDLTSSARAVQIASTAGKVVNLLDVNVPTSDPQILLKVRFASRGSQPRPPAWHQPVRPGSGKCAWRGFGRPVYSTSYRRQCWFVEYWSRGHRNGWNGEL